MIGLGETYPAAASIHLAANLTNLFILESVRAHYLGDCQGVVSNTLPCENGWFRVPEAPGLGVELAPETYSRPEVSVRSVA